MLKITDFLVRSIQTYTQELSWEIEPTTEDPLDYTFQIYRSESEAGPFETITGPFSDKYYFIDNVLPEDNRWRKFYYFIEVVRKYDSKESHSDVQSTGDPRNLYAKEISRIERLAFKEAAGIRAYIFPIKTFGQWCTCFDYVSKERNTDRCLNCYNTNFVGGYHNAVETFVQVRQFVEQNTTEQPIVQQRSAVTIIVTNYPRVKPGDIVWDPDKNLRWKVASVEPTRLGGSLVHQNVTASLVDRDQVEYEIELEGFDVFRSNSPEMLTNPRTTL